MKRKPFGLVMAVALAAGVIGSGLVNTAMAEPDTVLTLAEPTVSTQLNPNKIDVMGIYAHPDDEAGMATPCGVWHDKFGIRCGIIMATRGEGGSNSVGAEAGPALGLRRENEDRASHVRSGTIDIFNIDRVDFFYNTSAQLTAQVWDATETLRRTVRIIRETQPEILLGSTPGLGAGHGNHQYAQGRMIWEAAAAAADSNAFPEQLTGTGAVAVWQVKKILAGGLTTMASTPPTTLPNCLKGLLPAATNPFTVVGTWTGYESPYVWPAGNYANMPVGIAKNWVQVGSEGGRAHATQARSMYKAAAVPTCQMYGVSQSWVPMQPNSAAAGGRDESLFYGATKVDPGGMPLGSLFYVEAADYFGAAGEPITVTVKARSAQGTIAAGTVALTLPAGWTSVPATATLGPIGTNALSQVTFTVTPSASATPDRFKISASFTSTDVTAYNDTRVQLVSAVDGRWTRTGLQAEYDQWAGTNSAWVAGLSTPVDSIGAGESKTVSVVVTNRSAIPQTGTVVLSGATGMLADFAVDTATKPFTSIQPGTSQTVSFVITHNTPSAAGGSTVNLVATTTTGTYSSAETLQLRVVPIAVIPQLSAAPTVDATTDQVTAVGGANLDTSLRWEGSVCNNQAGSPIDCGTGSYASLGWFDNDLYGYFLIKDDVASAAATPDRCFGHWLVDSVELLLDPRGNSLDTSTTFKLGLFPFTDDSANYNGNGVDGPCWSRDADNYQGFSTGPLADDLAVRNGGLYNAPGVSVKANAVRHSDGSFAGNQWAVAVKIPLADLPAAIGPTSSQPTGVQATNVIDPTFLGLNVTPYDSDTQDFIGKTRTAWSAFGSQQSEPPRWGHAYLPGYTPPPGPAVVAPPARVPDTALTGVESPETIYQSAARGVTMSGVQPSTALTVTDQALTSTAVAIDVTATAAGTARAYLWKGDPKAVQVWTTSCVDGDVYGFDACDAADGAAAAWAPDMGGHLITWLSQPIAVGAATITVPLTAAQVAVLDTDAMLLLSFEEAAPASGKTGDGVAAWRFPMVRVPIGPSLSATPTPTVTVPSQPKTTVTAPGPTVTVPGVTATAPGATVTAPGTAVVADNANSGNLTVTKATPKVTAKAAKSAKAKAKFRVRITVKSAKVTRPTGSIVVKVTKAGKTVVKRTVKLKAKHLGKITVKLRAPSRAGKYQLKVTYKGNAKLTAKAAKALKLKVKAA